MSKRSRCFSFIVYSELWDESSLYARLSSTHIPLFVSPLHDRDLSADVDDGQSEWLLDSSHTYKKPHWHVMCCYSGPKSLAQVQSDFDGIPANSVIQAVRSRSGYGRYLCHLDDPDKAQYDIDSVVSLNGLDYRRFLREVSPEDGLKSLLRYIVDHQCVNFSLLCLEVMDTNPDLWQTLRTCNQSLVMNFIRSYAFGLRTESEDALFRAQAARVNEFQSSLDD